MGIPEILNKNSENDSYSMEIIQKFHENSMDNSQKFHENYNYSLRTP